MVKLLFFRLRVMNVKLINENNSLIIAVSKRLGLNTKKYGPELTPYLDAFHAVIFFHLAYFVVSTTSETMRDYYL